MNIFEAETPLEPLLFLFRIFIEYNFFREALPTIKAIVHTLSHRKTLNLPKNAKMCSHRRNGKNENQVTFSISRRQKLWIHLWAFVNRRDEEKNAYDENRKKTAYELQNENKTDYKLQNENKIRFWQHSATTFLWNAVHAPLTFASNPTQSSLSARFFFHLGIHKRFFFRFSFHKRFCFSFSSSTSPDLDQNVSRFFLSEMNCCFRNLSFSCIWFSWLHNGKTKSKTNA